MTSIDLKRARELAEMMNRCGCQGIHQHEAASLIRSLCDKIERDETEISMLSREVSREGGLRRKLSNLLASHEKYLAENRKLDDDSRKESAIAAAGREKA